MGLGGVVVLRLEGELIRGGTSKCWIFDRSDVEATGVPTDALLLAAYNAADPRQIDGVGGATSTTSKAAIVQPSADLDIDVEYAFAQVGIGDQRVEWGSNCGNCATAVALYAIHHGLVAVTGPSTTVRMSNINTGARLVATIPTPGGRAPDEGHAVVPGTDALGVPVLLGFQDPADSTTGLALPTGHAVDKLPGPDGQIEATLVNAGAPAALFGAADFGLDATESAAEFAPVVPVLATLRRQAAVAMGLADETDPISHAVPKVGVVATPRPYQTADDRRIDSDDYDLAVRMVSMHAPHPAIGLTSAVAVAVAAAIPGTLAHRHARPRTDGTLRLGTPAGVITAQYLPAAADQFPTVLLHRAARRIARAEVLVPLDLRPTKPFAPTA
jgi:2-methylaconitate cis-trans-isomerase PrpF